MTHYRITHTVQQQISYNDIIICPLQVRWWHLSDLHLEWNSEAVRVILPGNIAGAGDGSLHGLLHVQVSYLVGGGSVGDMN